VTRHSLRMQSGALFKDVFGDKESAVRIRRNSHYRISEVSTCCQVGMLIVSHIVNCFWAMRGTAYLSYVFWHDFCLLSPPPFWRGEHFIFTRLGK